MLDEPEEVVVPSEAVILSQTTIKNTSTSSSKFESRKEVW
jgi:hypothetical protein